MTARQFSARLCRYCARTENQNRQRRSASTLAASDSFFTSTSTQEEQQQQQQFDSQNAGSPIASTSKIQPLSSTKLAASLRFEVSQARPVPRLVWTQFKQLFQDGNIPASPSEKDLIERTIPILMQYNKPNKNANGQGKIIAIRESAEALYGRYRFVCNRLKEAGQLEQTPEQLLGWLNGLENLGYGPAAWKIWDDHLENTRELGVKLSIPVAHSVLITTMRWLVLMKKEEGSQWHKERNVPESLDRAYAIVQTLQDNNLYDWIARSLLIRTVKESGLTKEFEKLLKKEFSFDPAFPSLLSRDEESGQMLSSPERMDVDTFNTILSRYANKDDLSKMISLFETATCTSRRASKLRQTADQNSFISTSLYPQTEKQQTAMPFFTTANSAAHTQEQHSMDTTKQANEADPSLDARPTERESPDPSSNPIGVPSAHPISLRSVNTYSFELLIETALRLDRIRLAHHYLRQLFQAWQHEQERLKAVYANYVSQAEKMSNAYHIKQNDPQDPENETTKLSDIIEDTRKFLKQGVMASRVSLSIHSIWLLYDKFKFSRSQKQKYGAVVLSTLEIAKEALEVLRRDAGFWEDAYRAEEALQEYLPLETNVRPTLFIDDRVQHDHHQSKVSLDSNTNSMMIPKPKLFNLKTHKLLQARLEYELTDLTRHIEVSSMDLKVERETGPLLYALSERRWLKSATAAAAAEEETSRTASPTATASDDMSDICETENLRERRIRLAIESANRWLVKDSSRDEERLALLQNTLRSNSKMTTPKIENKLRNTRLKFLNKRKLVIEALEKAKSLQSDALAAKRIAEEERQREYEMASDAKAQMNAGTDTLGRTLSTGTAVKEEEEGSSSISYAFSSSTTGNNSRQGTSRSGNNNNDDTTGGGGNTIRLLHSDSLSGKLSLA